MPVTDVGMAPDTASGPYLRLSPLRHGTDGFFAAALVRNDQAPPPDSHDQDPPRPEE